HKRSVLTLIFPQYLQSLIYRTILHPKPTQHPSRITPITNPSHNPTQLIHHLSLQYNTPTQPAITQQITQIL
ncbi:F0F1 ATP synthase subunit gamma, partial [Staphylococcus epidermidis]|uniref:F0F1 ATP synthase subunit gamma n=1 Tax=Staphylococcus epidermidis TaxID=1282 RepID=UPI0016433108